MKLRPLALILASTLFSSLAFGQAATRTWVSGVGDDSNPGSRTAPCKTFAGDISKTAAGGIISVLDPGGFGTVTITKSIEIDGGGFEGGILAASTSGVTINAAATDIVVLRNLQIQGVQSATIGVNILSAGAVYLEHCTIKGFQTGVNVAPAAAAVKVFVHDSVIQDCTTQGLLIAPASGITATVYVQHARVEGCGIGLFSQPGGTAILDDSTIVGCTADGLKRTAPGVIKSYRTNVLLGNNPDGKPSAYVTKK